jgi:PKD repeat protein
LAITAIEMGIDNCVYLQPGISGSTLIWNVGGGSETTIDHYTVFSSTDGENLTKLADAPAGTHSLDLSQFNLASGTLMLYVKATGRPSIQNKMSPPIVFLAGDQPPTVSLAVSQTEPLTFTVSTAGSTDPNGVASSTIDFGDGTAVSGANASHTYANVGTYNITATVFDSAGTSSIAIQRVSAKAIAPGVTIFSPTPSGVVNWPTPSFVASGNGANPITQMNVLLDGTQIYAINQDTVNTALKIYSGSHHVEVQATDSTGTTSSAAVDITAEPNDPAPVPAIQVTPLPQVAPNTLLLCGARWQDNGQFVNAYQWTFSDGSSPALTPGIVHTFSTSGSYSIIETVIDEFGISGSLTQSVSVSGTTGTTASATTVQTQDEQTQRQNLPIRLPQLGSPR